MLEIWLREGKVRLPALVMLETGLWVRRLRHFCDEGHPHVMLETWLRESGVPRLRNFLISSGNLYRIITPPFLALTTPW